MVQRSAMISLPLYRLVMGAAALLAGPMLFHSDRVEAMESKNMRHIVDLPSPKMGSDTSIEKALLQRRSIRNYSEQEVTIDELAQLLWAAQGVTDQRGLRTAPSAGALYPLEVAVVAGNVRELSPGIYRYQPTGHTLIQTIGGDHRSALSKAGLSQGAIRRAPVVLVFSGVYERTTRKYGDRGVRYVHMEAGHAAQNVCLQAVSLGLGAVVIGAFDDAEVKKVMRLNDDEAPLYILPVGRVPADESR